MQHIKETRAKRGYIATKYTDKAGRRHTGRDHMVASEGMFSTKEMERTMEEVADSVGASYDDIRIEYYDHGDAPIEANPRHRGWVSQNQWGGYGEGVRKNANHPIPKEND